MSAKTPSQSNRMACRSFVFVFVAERRVVVDDDVDDDNVREVEV